MSSLKNLYRDTIRKHAAEPVGFRRAINATHRCEGHNPLCGDRVDIALEVSAGVIRDAAFEGEACSICMASASLMCEQIRGVDLEWFRSLKMLLTTALETRDGSDDIGALSPLLGVRPYPSRIQCAILPWTTAERALGRQPS